MDVRLPDGTVVTNVPEGISQAELMRRLGKSMPEESPGEKRRSRRDLANEYAGKDVGEMGALMRGLGGAKGAFDRAAMGLKGLFTDLTPEDKALLEQGKAFEAEGGPAATVGSIGADVAMSAAPGAFVTKAAAAAPLLARTAAQLGLGAGYGALTSPEDRAEGAKQGALGSAIGMGVNRVIGGALKPAVTDDAAALLKRGVVPTPGQAVGGVANQIEQKLQSVPVMGDVIRSGRNRAVKEFNEAAIQTAAPGIKGVGDEALTAARKQIGDKYEAALSKLPSIKVDQTPIIKAVTDAVDDPALALSDASKKRVLDYVEKNLLARGTDIDGQIAKRIESDMSKVVTRFKSGTSTGEEKAMGEALDSVLQQWRSSLSAAAGPSLREADQAWRAFLPLDKAAASAGSQAAETTGQFTPRALRRAIEAADKSQNNNVTRAMRGGNSPFERLNTLSRQGENVLTNSVPDSGTAGRLMTSLGALGAGAAGVSGYALPVAAGTVGALGAYSRPGSQLLLQGLEPAYKKAVQTLALRGVPTQTLDEVLRKYGPQGVIALARGQALNQD